MTVAEHKRASARAVRCGHRKPDGGCAVRRRRRGALPLCGGDILQTLAGPCPVFRRGRCLHRPGNPAAAQTSKRRAKTPALHCGRKRVLTRKFQPTARPTGGPMQASAPTQGTAALHNRHPPTMPAPRSRRPYALHCRAGVHARRGGFTAARKGIGKARRRTPQSAGADSSPYRGAFQAAVLPKPPLQGAAKLSAACGGESETEQV